MEYTNWLKLLKAHDLPKEIQDSVSMKEGKRQQDSQLQALLHLFSLFLLISEDDMNPHFLSTCYLYPGIVLSTLHALFSHHNIHGRSEEPWLRDVT